MRAACVVFFSLLTCIAHAQEPASTTRERAMSNDEMTAAITLYSVGGAGLLAGAIMLPIGIFDLNGIGCSGACDEGAALYWAGITTLAVSGIVVLIAVGLTIDAALRNARLDAAVALGPHGLELRW